MSARIALIPRSGFARLVLAALALRLLLLPLSHTWDAQSWVNVFAQLGTPAPLLDAIQQPYETMREQSLLAQAAGRHTDHYEYWAYPPLMLYAWWPLARVYSLLGGEIATTFPVQPSFFAPAVPLALQALIRLPIIVADIVSLVLLRRLGLRVAEVRWYAFNPLVLLVGIWTFDSVMVTFLLLALLFATRHRWLLAGVALALGAGTKFVPLVALPAVLLAIASTDASPMRRARIMFTSCLACILVVIVLIWPVLVYAMRFHAERFGAGLSLGQIWIAWARQLPNVDWQPVWPMYATILFGTLQLPLALLAGAYLLVRIRVSLAASFLIAVLAFLVGSKIVNEAYALAPLALMTVVLHERQSNALLDCRALLWVLPFAYAVLNAPLWAFSFSLIQGMLPGSTLAVAAWADAFRYFRSYPEASLPYAFLGIAFCLTAAFSAWLVTRDSRLAHV